MEIGELKGLIDDGKVKYIKLGIPDIDGVCVASVLLPPISWMV